MHILLFDIDGTLINTGGSGLEALKTAFAEVFDRPHDAPIETRGQTDRGIARGLLCSHQIEETPENWSRFNQAYLRHLALQLPLRDGTLLPGVVTLLEMLAARDDMAVGLLTGNTEEGARIKLKHYGIAHHFPFGGYGGISPLRDDVAEAALAAARSHVPVPFSPEQVWVIGDTPLDISCARHIGANVAAVATGWHEKDELLREAPDLLLDDLEQHHQLLTRITQDKR